MTIVMSESRLPECCAEEGGRVTTPAELAEVNERTARTMRRVESAPWVIAAFVVAILGAVLIVHWWPR